MEQEEIMQEIRKKCSELQTEFIMSLIRLCDEYGIRKTEFIRETVRVLNELSLSSNFDQLKSE